jgi:hypothetical protein
MARAFRETLGRTDSDSNATEEPGQKLRWYQVLPLRIHRSDGPEEATLRFHPIEEGDRSKGLQLPCLQKMRMTDDQM